jgi:CopG family nickel-responsive transcriptional regulator
MTHRFTISLETELAREFDSLIAERGYASRSEAVRDLLRGAIGRERLAGRRAPWCIAALSYLYDHGRRELSERLAALQHAHADLCVATTHAHLARKECLETLILRGRTEAVRRFADAVIAERGVHYGKLNLVPLRHAPGPARGARGRAGKAQAQ